MQGACFAFVRPDIWPLLLGYLLYSCDKSFFVRSALAGLWQSLINHFGKITHRQKLVRQASRHCGRHAKGLVNANPIVPEKIERKRVTVEEAGKAPQNLTLLYAGGDLEKARQVFAAAIYYRPRIRLTIRQRARVLEQWPKAVPSLRQVDSRVY
jgi:hypothetical protein